LSRIGSTELWRLTALLTILLVIGLLVGHTSVVVMLGLAAYLAWHLTNLFNLEHWLSEGSPSAPPTGHGVWGEIYHHFYRLRRRNRERKKRLAAIIDRFQGATKAMPDATIVLSATGEIEWFNKAATRLCGLRPGQDAGRPIKNLIRHPAFTSFLASGDFSEPVTQASLRVAGALWALDTDLAYRRHFPAVDWNKSFSLYYNSLKEWFAREIADDAFLLRDSIMKILEQEGELKEIVQIIGLEALQDSDRLKIEVGRIIKEVFLRQSIFNEADAFCPMEKQYMMMKCIIQFYNKAKNALMKGMFLEKILTSPITARIMRMQDIPGDVFKEKAEEIMKEIDTAFGG